MYINMGINKYRYGLTLQVGNHGYYNHTTVAGIYF